MNKKLSLAVAGAVLAFGASAANAGIIIPAGDWTVDIGGNVNAFYTQTHVSGNKSTILGLGTDTGTQDVSNITTGLLPNYLSVSGKTRQNDLDVGFTISVNPGASTRQAGFQGAQQENRQAFVTFGDKSWGSIKLGKDLGIFASDAILNDMTLLGVGSAAGSLAGNTTTLGRIGTGYVYADWKAQVAYSSPNWNGFSFTGGVTQAFNALEFDGGVGSNSRGGGTPAVEGKASYEWAGDFAGKVWVSGIYQKIRNLGVAANNSEAYAGDVGATVNVYGVGVTGYYYRGEGIGQTVQFLGGFDAKGDKRTSSGGYVQGTYVLPGIGTKLGVSWGESILDGGAGGGTVKDRMWTLGAYHPITKHLNLVAEYDDVKHRVNAVGSGYARTLALGAILFF